MKCKHCNGTGKVRGYFYEKTGVNKWEKVWGDSPCDECNGTGEIELTEQEYIQTCNTEQLADLMSRMVGCSNCPIPKDGRNCMGTYSGCWHEIIKWLKQPHRGES